MISQDAQATEEQLLRLIVAWASRPSIGSPIFCLPSWLSSWLRAFVVVFDPYLPGPSVTIVIGSNVYSRISARSESAVTAFSVAMSISSERYCLL